MKTRYAQALATVLLATVAAVYVGPHPAFAQQSNEALAKAAQNPVADLISLPLQNNMAFDVGPGEDILNVLNIQPVYPFRVGNWNLINRTIVPVVSQPEFVAGQGRKSGLGDINHTTFFSPAEPSKVIWGIGPVLRLPTASDDRLGSEKWSAGPGFVALTVAGDWVIGALVQNVWSFAGDDDRADVNEFLLQYFVNYNIPGGWYLSSAPINIANWEAERGHRWTAPVGGGGGKIFRVGKLPMNALAQVFYNVEKPEPIGDWALRLQLQMLFPK